MKNYVLGFVIGFQLSTIIFSVLIMNGYYVLASGL